MTAARWFGAVTMTAVLTAAPGLAPVATLRAHEGHTHTVMGTVSKVADGQLEVKTPAGKVETIVTTAKTAVTRGKDAATLKDVAAGQRVVVDVGDGKTPLTARGIKLGVAAPAAGAKPGTAAPKS